MSDTHNVVSETVDSANISDSAENNVPAKGVLLLYVSNVVVKVAGLGFKLPMTAKIGEEGMGYFNTAYSLFTWLYMLSTAGLPTATALLISRARAKNRDSAVRKIFSVSLCLFVLLGLLGSCILGFGAESLSAFLKVGKAKYAMIAISPTLFFICLSAALRGYFQGFSELRPHAVSQMAEAFGKVCLGVALANYALSLSYPPELAAAGAAVGLTVGICLGTLVLFGSLFFCKNAKIKSVGCSHGSDNNADTVCRKNGGLSLAADLVKIALPITLSSSVMSLTSLFDTLIMTARLHDIGYSEAEAVAAYGNYTSLALPMFNLPPVFVYPLVYALVPKLAASLGRGNIASAVDDCKAVFEKAVWISMPMAVGLAALSKPILSLFFAPELVSRGADMLTLLAPSSFMLCMVAVTNTVLQSSGHEKMPLVIMFVGAVVKLCGSYVLIPICGRYGIPISTFCCYAVILLLSVGAIAVKTSLGTAFLSKRSIYYLFASGLAVWIAVIFRQMVPDGRIGTLSAVLIAAVCYGLLTFREILSFLPKRQFTLEKKGNA